MNIFGLLGDIHAQTGRGEEFARLLLDDSKDLRGDLVSVVAKDAADSDWLSIAEVWERQQVQHAIAKGGPLIASSKRRPTPGLSTTAT